jgi:integrase
MNASSVVRHKTKQTPSKGEHKKWETSGRQKILSKTDSRYWMQPKKLRKWERSANFSVCVQIHGKRHSFGLGTSNKEAAAKKASVICADIANLGMDAALAKYKPLSNKSDKVATIGEWIEAAQRVTTAKTFTFDEYARCLRVIASEIRGMKKTNERFNPHKNGGHAKYRAKINADSLDILTPASIQKWRLSYVARGKNPAERLSRQTSCNTTIRQARSLFSEKVTKFIPHLRLPDPIPFAGVEFFPRQNTRYHSQIDPVKIARSAQDELFSKHPSAFLAFLLAFGAGLRRSEIDTLCWHQIDFRKSLIRVETTDVASLKSADSRGEVGIDPDIAALLQGFRAKGKEGYVVEGETGTANPTKRRSYRANKTFAILTPWLRRHGITAQKPLHELRKELGSLITQEHGIYAASRVMRHSSPETTARHYSDIKTLPIVQIGGWETPENLIQMPAATPSKTIPVKKKKA